MSSVFSSIDILAGKVRAPVSLFESSLSGDRLEAWMSSIWSGFPWEQRDAPRRECFFSTLGEPYSYGSGAGRRTYWPKDMPELLVELTEEVEKACTTDFELCFANGYASEREHLGWHADDSPEIDDARPIAVMSLGAEREIWVKPIGASADEVEKILLPSGSLFIMGPDMQDTHFHRIPKHPQSCGPRVSLTWRGAAVGYIS